MCSASASGSQYHARMMQRRGAVVAWSGAVTAAAIAAATLFASSQKHPFGNPWVILFVVVGAIAFVMLIVAGVPDVAAWIADEFRAVFQRERPPELELTRWSYTSDPVNLPAATLLDEPPLSGLVSALTTVPDDAAWSKRATYDSALDAILTGGSDEEAVASARLELPDGTRRFGRDARSAVFIIQVEPSGNDASRAHAGWREWTERIARVLQAVPAVADFLSVQLGLGVTAEPRPTVAVRLETPNDLAALIGTGKLESLPGKQHFRLAIGYFAASPGGTSAADAAEQMVRHVMRYALQIDV
jgi:hypothetical protein